MPNFCFFCGNDGGIFNCGEIQQANICPLYKEVSEDQDTIGQWQKQTFPGASLYSAVVRMLQEAHELVGLFWIDRDHALQHPKMPDKDKIAGEIADVYITLVGVAEKAGVNIQQAVNTKMKINRERVWKIDASGNGYHV